MRKILLGKVLLASALAALLVWSGMVSAQQPPKPGPEHTKLKALEGAWEATIYTKEGQSKGTMTYAMGLGGLWLFENFKGEFSGAPFEGKGASTYDPAKKKYISIWLDSMSTSPMISEGNYDAAGKIMTMQGEMAGHDGKMMKVTMTSELKDPDNMVFTMTSPGPDGKSFEMMKITYKRKAK